jgi:hypothetical protein
MVGLMYTPPSIEELAGHILPWAKANQPDAYRTTLATRDPGKFRRLLGRLIELRCQADPDFAPPWRILHETGLTLYQTVVGVRLPFKGRWAPVPRDHLIRELDAPDWFLQLKLTLDATTDCQ